MFLTCHAIYNIIFPAGFDNTEIVQLLLEHGAVVNRRTQSGTTPLQSAALQGNKGEIAYQGFLEVGSPSHLKVHIIFLNIDINKGLGRVEETLFRGKN